MALTIDTTQQVIATLQPIDGLGRPALYQTGSIVFTSSDTSLFTVLPEIDNELSALITAVGVGSATLSYSGINLAGGLFTGSVEVTITAAQAVGFNITFETPTEQTISTSTTSTTTV